MKLLLLNLWFSAAQVVLPACLPVTNLGSAAGLDISNKDLQNDDFLYNHDASLFKDPHMVVAYDCLCGHEATTFMMECKAGNACNQITGYCVPSCPIGKQTDEFCSCGTATSNDPDTQNNCLSGQLCVGYDELHDSVGGTYGNTAHDADRRLVGWNGEAKCVPVCSSEYNVDAAVCACGGGFCSTTDNKICAGDQCIAKCDNYMHTSVSVGVVNPCKCGKDVCREDEVCADGTCIPKCTMDTQIFKEQCWCPGASNKYLCTKDQLCNSASGSEICVDKCKVVGATREVVRCRCGNNLCLAADDKKFCLNGKCVRYCSFASGFYESSNSTEAWCACGETSCKRSEYCAKDTCVPQCVNDTLSTGPCWCADPAAQTSSSAEPSICGSKKPVCLASSYTCSRFEPQTL